jgi:hypothetical protein
MTTEHASACSLVVVVDEQPNSSFRKPRGTAVLKSILSVCGYGFPDVQLHIEARAKRHIPE